MQNKMFITEAGNLLQDTGVHKDDIKRIIDVSKLDITPEYINEQSRLRHSKFDENYKFVDARKKPKYGDTLAEDRYYVSDLCLPYNPMPDDRDTFVYFDNIRALSGRAGYIRIRDGYVYGIRATRIS